MRSRVSSFKERNVRLLAPTCLCLSSSRRKAQTQGFLTSAPLTLRRDKGALSSSFLSKAGSSQQHSSHPLTPYQPPLAACNIRMKIRRLPPGVVGREPQSKPHPLQPACSVTQHGAWSLLAGGLPEMISEVPLKRHMFPPLVQRTFIQFLLLRELWGEGILLHNKIQGSSQGGEDLSPAPRSQRLKDDQKRG